MQTLPSTEPPRRTQHSSDCVEAEAANDQDLRDLWPKAQVPSWVFGPHFRYKMYAIAPVGLLFGLKYGITNLGLKLVPTGMHLLLQVRTLKQPTPHF